MPDQKIVALIEDIAFEVVSFDGVKARALKKLISLFEELQLVMGDEAEAAERALVTRCVSHLQHLAKKPVKNGKKRLSDLGEDVAQLQKLVVRRAAAAAMQAEAPVPAASVQEKPAAPASESKKMVGEESDANAFALPEWVEERVFTDFLSQQQGVLDEIEGDILAIEKEGEGAGAALKRRLHTMKGEAGMLGLDGLEKACHAVEDFIIRPGPSAARIDRLLQFRDWVVKALASYGRLRMPTIPCEEMIALLESPLVSDSMAALSTEVAPAKIVAPAQTVASEIGAPAPPRTEMDWDEETIATFGEFYHESEEGLSNADQILLRVEHGGIDTENLNTLFRVFHSIKGVAGFLDLREISRLAHTTETMLNHVRQGQLDLEGGVLDLVFDATGLMRRMMKAMRDAVEVREAFADTLELPPLFGRMQAAIHGGTAPPQPVPAVPPGLKLGEILTLPPINVSAEVVNTALKTQKESGRPLGEELVAMGEVEAKQVGLALRSQKAADGKEASGSKMKETVKVDIDRIDSLVEMIGELVIVESMVVNADEIGAIASPRVRNYLSQLGKLTRDLQDVGMRMRMVPVRGVFQKMARMVRDLSRKKGVQIRFEIDGEGTEMDRSMVEQISDPLVHMIRNAVDHGMESTEARRTAGKDEAGTIKLSAYHEAGSIVIELADDGAGLNREAIQRKAREQGIITDKDILTESEIHNLIFAPGFSTATQVTEISGRGVGMDVVRRNVEAMRGRVGISSIAGKGTTFKMVLPLTLAIIEGMLVASGNERYIIPTLSVVESMVLQKHMFFSFAGSHELINVRGEILPVVRLSHIFDIKGAKAELTEGLVVIVEGVGTRFGIFIDDVVTQQQVVIKSLGAGITATKLVSGAAILSDGRVGLILNVDELGSLLVQAACRGKQQVAYQQAIMRRADEDAVEAMS